MSNNKNKIKELADRYFNGLNVRIDIDVLFPQLIKYDINLEQLEILFKSIIRNMDFFEKELNYSLQVSNLFFFEIDARNEPQETCRGTEYRHNLTKRYRKLLDLQNKISEAH